MCLHRGITRHAVGGENDYQVYVHCVQGSTIIRRSDDMKAGSPVVVVKSDRFRWMDARVLFPLNNCHDAILPQNHGEA